MSDCESHVNWDNLQEIFNQEDKTAFWEEMLEKAKYAAKVCGCRGSCRQNVTRVEGILSEHQKDYDTMMGYLFPNMKKGPKSQADIDWTNYADED